MCSFLGYKSELDDLQKTVETVKAVLLDAGDKDELSHKHEAQLWIQELKDAVYDADDLLDEFVTLAELKQHKEGGKVSKKVHLFFSRFNPLTVAYNMSRGVKKIRKKLDAVASNHSKFGFSVDSQPIRKRREETCSYVYEGSIIGREDDVEKIVGLLLGSDIQEDVSFLTIVGIGGLGKTALAQLVFNDVRVTSAFPLRLWTCVSDHDQDELDVEGILRKILASVTGKKDEGSTKDLVQRELRENFVSNKCLLVLDDVWTENRNKWQKLIEFLLGGHRGSWIVVTTRSYETARIVGGGLRHELQGLSRERSRLLFDKTAFGSEQSTPCEDLVEIGREIVEQCAGVPLAIRVVGSLLYGQYKSKWLSFQKTGLSNLRDSQTDILATLKLSYDQLEPPLKSCFTYCALFPKDYEIEKELLISLWMAQGFIVPFNETQRVEDAAEDYFFILLRRCFFQEVKRDDYGEIFSCKIHDLMHDMAQKVAGKEICVTNSVINMDEKVRHLAFKNGKCAQHPFTKTHIRSFLNVSEWVKDAKMHQLSLEALVANWMCLRALDLSNSGLINLPESIGELLHLRYLDLSMNDELEVLPKSIIKLFNMQTLKLTDCSRLKELPKDLNKLVKLRVLDLCGCYELNHMPRGMGKMSCLHTLNLFLLNSSSWKHLFDELEELKGLENLKGNLKMMIKFPMHDPEGKDMGGREGSYLRNKEHLNAINIWFCGSKFDKEVLRSMEELQSHSNLRALELTGFLCFGLPSWARGNNLKTFLPNLNRLKLSQIKIEYVTCLGNLPHLKSLLLESLRELEYIIEYSATLFSTSTAERSSLFPSLERLELRNLPKLEGWRISKMEVGDKNHLLTDSSSDIELLLPQLKSMKIASSPKLEATLLCPILEDLEVCDSCERLQTITALSEESGDEEAEATSSSPVSSSSTKLRKIFEGNVEWRKSPSIKAFQCLRIPAELDTQIHLPVRRSTLEYLSNQTTKLLNSLK